MAAQQYQAPQSVPAEELGGGRYRIFLKKMFEYKNDSDYPYNKRVFVTLCKPTSGSLYGVDSPPFGEVSGSSFIEPIRTSITGGFIGEVGIRSNDLAELATFEAVGVAEVAPINSTTDNSSHACFAFVPSPRFPLNEQYINKAHINPDHGANAFNHPNQQISYLSGSYVVSMCQDDNPSLLIELNKAQELPDGLGTKEFVVIQENLHPFIKDNLEFFLTRGGVNVSGDTSNLINVNEARRKLK